MSSSPPPRETFEVLHDLIAASLSGEITEEDRRQLDNLICEDPHARRMYLQYVSESVGLRWWSGEQLETQPVATKRPAIVPAIWLHVRQGFRGFATSRSFLWLLFGIAASAVEVALILWLLVPRWQLPSNSGSDGGNVVANAQAKDDDPDSAVAVTPVAHMLRMVECQWLNGSGPSAAGDVLAGQDLWLASGYAELKFQSGTRVVLQGPAWLTPTAVGEGLLHQGKLTARVPKAAKGFAINTPTGRVVDLGTEFGLHVLPSGETMVHVFEGHVEARPIVEGGATAGPVLLVSGQSARMTREVRLLGAAEVGSGTGGGEFVRWLPEHGRFPLFATGRGLEEGAVDPHWQIAHESMPSEFKPALVIQPNPVWLPNDHYSSQWLSLVDGQAVLPSGRYVYRTQFDLSKYNAAKARIIGRWMADNRVEEIRLNGQVVSAGPVESGFGEFEQFTITEGFAAGENTVEFIVVNDGVDANPMGLRVEWYGMAESKKLPVLDERSTPDLEGRP